MARLLLRCEARLRSSTGCPTELPNSSLSAKEEATPPNTAFVLLESAVRDTPSMSPAREASEKLCSVKDGSRRRALLQGHLARERFLQQFLL